METPTVEELVAWRQVAAFFPPHGVGKLVRENMPETFEDVTVTVTAPNGTVLYETTLNLIVFREAFDLMEARGGETLEESAVRLAT